MKSICGRRELISAFMDGALSEKDAAAMDAHLKTCPECRKEMAAFRNLNSLLRGMNDIAPSDDFARGFWRKLDAEKARKPLWHIINPMTWGWQPAAAFAAIFLIVGGIAFFRAIPLSRINVVSDAAFQEIVDAAAMPISEDFDFYQDMELISRLDFLENWDAVNRIEEI